MNTCQIDLIKSSWSNLISLDENPGILFYTHLFELDSSLERLFNGDIKAQSMKFTSMVTFFAYKLDDWEGIKLEAKNLGKRHTLYHVPDSSYRAVEMALMFTLKEALANLWNLETETAWKDLYLELEDLMVQEVC